MDSSLEVVQGWSNSQNGVLPVIVCGDFNSTPESAVYELLTTGRLSPSSIPVGHRKIIFFISIFLFLLFFQDDPYGILPPVNQMHHSLPLRSIYPAVVNSEATYTNYTQKFQGNRKVPGSIPARDIFRYAGLYMLYSKFSSRPGSV